MRDPDSLLSAGLILGLVLLLIYMAYQGIQRALNPPTYVYEVNTDVGTFYCGEGYASVLVVNPTESTATLYCKDGSAVFYVYSCRWIRDANGWQCSPGGVCWEGACRSPGTKPQSAELKRMGEVNA